MAQRRSGAVIFDVDGTLIDNSYLHTVAWSRACAECGVPVAMARLHRLIGRGSDQLIDALFHREWPELSDAHTRHMEPLRAEQRVFPEAAALLRTIAARGASVVIGTSAKEDELKGLLRLVDADDAIAAVTSSSDVDSSKPAPDIFGVALERAGVDADRAAVVGDTGWDVEAARRAGLRCVAVETGGWSRGELEAAGAVAVYRDVEQLLGELERSPLGALLDR